MQLNGARGTDRHFSMAICCGDERGNASYGPEVSDLEAFERYSELKIPLEKQQQVDEHEGVQQSGFNEILFWIVNVDPKLLRERPRKFIF
jgi:hypothetical protein